MKMKITMVDHAIAQRLRIGNHPSTAQRRRHVEGLVRLNKLLAKSEGYAPKERYAKKAA